MLPGRLQTFLKTESDEGSDKNTPSPKSHYTQLRLPTHKSSMGRGESDDWDEKYPGARQTQPPSYEEAQQENVRSTESSKPKKSCPTCCLKTRDCLMSGECGRCLQISSVIAMCGMCIRMFVFKLACKPAGFNRLPVSQSNMSAASLFEAAQTPS
ncbi:unnamed protein product [Pleuronectes platessa]|uniref:Uncharacterized protein n=1 Tax=Pleuronectes platessa TaxID=8262 RepID=A0A9N7ZDD6_PLEPL|nr:unnamed protein product [Pleuronectes platessa]